MSDFSERIVEAFKAVEMRSIVIEEWDATIYVRPVTVLQLSEIWAEPDTFLRAVKTIRIRAKNADGSPFITTGEADYLIKKGLGKYGPKVIARVATEIDQDIPDQEGVEKK